MDRSAEYTLQPSLAAIAPLPSTEFLSRDLSWLEFNRRVLYQAVDERTPMLERLRFLGIFTSNLDEFFMKRIGALKRQIASGVAALTPDGRTPAQVLSAIREAVLPMIAQQGAIYQQLKVQLAQNSVHILEWEELTESEQKAAHVYFQRNVFAVLTPLAVDPGNPFPFISNLSASLGIILVHPDQGENLFARVKVPEVLPKWINISATPGEYRFVSLHEMIRHNLSDLFPDLAIVDVMLFRVTRNADIERDEEDAEDLRQLMEEELRQRRFANVVRLEHGPDANAWILDFLITELDLMPGDVYEMPAELDYDDLRVIMDLAIPTLRYEPWTPTVPPALTDEDTDIFALIRHGDLLLHHPYESFTASVERFIRSAATDPRVLAIKMSLYRTGDDGAFIKTLIRAAESGKQVVCLVELKARFDEQRNILIANALEKAGVHVVYGVVGLKTHCKAALIVRDEADGIRCYAHIGTGNYNSSTAKLYTDLGLFTCDSDTTRDVVELFHYLTGRSLKRHYRKLLVAPANMRDRLLELINREADHAHAGRPAAIIGKMNSLEERKVCTALYAASQGGVDIDLIVRGFCTLRPGTPGLSDRIRVISVVGRFLEHSRIFYFRNGAADPIDGEFYIGSADWMFRNLLARVEAVAPIERRSARERLWFILQTMLHDGRQAWDMDTNGKYTLRNVAGDIGTQQTLMNLARHEAVITPEELNVLRP